jgi:hypothetical protein
VKDPLRLRALAARDEIASGVLRGAALVELLEAVPLCDRDDFADELLGFGSPPEDVPDLPRGAVPYLPCGVDDILAMVRAVPMGPLDDFVDLGSGVGRVAILVHLLCGVTAHGIEIQEPLVQRAEACAAALNLSGVSFTHANAVHAELDGTVFFLYSPFNGRMLTDALERLRDVARRRPVVVCAVGLELHGLSWLRPRARPTVSLNVYDSLTEPRR